MAAEMGVKSAMTLLCFLASGERVRRWFVAVADALKQ
jgi:hypothetical protein